MYKRTLVVVLVVGLAVLPVRLIAQETTPFFMTFVPNVQFSQMYVGLEKGYFADAGFDFTLEYGNEPDGMELIALGERQFGLIAGEQVLLARANDRPVVSVYEWWQQYPIVIVTPADSGITSPADLAGRRVGVPGRFGATYSGLVAILASAELTEQDIDLQEIGFNAPEVVCLGGVEASAVYGNNEPLQIAQRAAANDCDAVEQVRVLPVAEYADLVSNGLVTSEMMIDNHPEQVQAMVAAFDRAVQDVINNPAEAYLISEAYIDNLPLPDDLREALTVAAAEQREFLTTDPTRAEISASREALLSLLREDFSPETLLQFEVLLATVELWDADQLGFAETAAWDQTQQTLLQMGFLDSPVDVSEAFTNRFLSE
jgi:NitT/TauT family transport system substrate-binding protein